jgi:hypothetical protein
MGIFILLKVYDFGSQQQSCGDWEICIYLLHKEGAFSECTQLSLVILHNGPEVIGSCAFLGTSIKSIKIPPLCHRNFGDAFEHWSNLTCVVFCDMINNCIQNVDEVLVESRCPRKVLKYLLLSRPG